MRTMLEGRRAKRSNITDAAINDQLLHNAGDITAVSAMRTARLIREGLTTAQIAALFGERDA